MLHMLSRFKLIFGSYLFFMIFICGIILIFIMYPNIDNKKHPKEEKIVKIIGYLYIGLGSILYIICLII